MSHLAESILRRHLDEPDVLLSYEKEHLLACAQCRAKHDAMRENAAFAAANLSGGGKVHLESALHQVSQRAGAGSAACIDIAPRRKVPTVSTRWFAAAAAVLALFVLIGYTPLRGYAENLLAIFEPHQFQPIGLTTADMNSMNGLPDLRAFGSFQKTGANEKFQNFSDSISAGQFAHETVLRPHYLPPGVPAVPLYHVSPVHTARFTFSATKAVPAMPSNIDGSTLSATIGPVVIQTFGEKRRFEGVHRAHRTARPRGSFLHELPQNIVVISQAPAPRVYSSGATLAQIEAYLLAQPQLPPSLVSQIRAIGDPTSTVPVPIPLDKQNAQTVNVNGANALLIGDNTGVGSAIIWQRNGMVYGVIGPYSAAEITHIATSLSP